MILAETNRTAVEERPVVEAADAPPAGGTPGRQAPQGQQGVPGEFTPRSEFTPRGDRGPRREGGGGRGGPRDFRSRRKVCVFCVDKTKEIDYKETGRLRRFISDRGKIDPRRKTGTCAKHQRRLSVALKRARFMALLPYTGEHIRSAESGRQSA